MASETMEHAGFGALDSPWLLYAISVLKKCSVCIPQNFSFFVQQKKRQTGWVDTEKNVNFQLTLYFAKVWRRFQATFSTFLINLVLKRKSRNVRTCCSSLNDKHSLCSHWTVLEQLHHLCVVESMETLLINLHHQISFT